MSIPSVHHFVNWCRYDLLPLWQKIGWDDVNGGYFEDLHLDGRPDRETTRRVRVTSRQVYSFAHATRLGWLDGREQVMQGVQWLLDKGRDADGGPGFVHLVDDAGNVRNAKRDLYDHAFHIMGFTHGYMASGDAQLLGLAKETLAFVEEALGSPHDSGWFEDNEGTLPRRQNPHMHMFEALLYLHEATQDGAYLKRAGKILELMQEFWLDQETGTLLEYFDADWGSGEPVQMEPGHMMEWRWLAHTYFRVGGKGENPTLSWPQTAKKLGQSPAGFLHDAVLPDGTPIKSDSRLWSQTEWLKALCAEAETGDATKGQTETLCKLLFRHYLVIEPAGLWIDQVNAAGAPLSPRVPASIVYHLVSAAAEAYRVLLAPDAEAQS